MDHVAFDVDDLDATLASLRARGVPVLDAAPIPVPPLGVRIAEVTTRTPRATRWLSLATTVSRSAILCKPLAYSTMRPRRHHR